MAAINMHTNHAWKLRELYVVIDLGRYRQMHKSEFGDTLIVCCPKILSLANPDFQTNVHHVERKTQILLQHSRCVFHTVRQSIISGCLLCAPMCYKRNGKGKGRTMGALTSRSIINWQQKRYIKQSRSSTPECFEQPHRKLLVALKQGISFFFVANFMCMRLFWAFWPWPIWQGAQTENGYWSTKKN